MNRESLKPLSSIFQVFNGPGETATAEGVGGGGGGEIEQQGAGFDRLFAGKTQVQGECTVL
jgi:hypothetical protein